MLWHARLGHPHVKTLQNVMNKLHVNGSPSNKIPFCEACQFGKMQQISFPISDLKTKAPLELIYSDLWGPAPVVSSEGYKYYIVFVDDFSRYMWIYPLKLKEESYAIFTQFHCFVEKELNAKVKCLQTDWGGEFRPFSSYLQQHGIAFRHPCPYLHQQNGRVERKHRAITEFGLALLAHAGMPLCFWWQAFSTAAYLLNRLPSASIGYSSPFQKLFDQEPRYNELRVFGCSCYPYIRPYQKHKLSYHTEKCVFLGYSLAHKGYKCLSSSGRIEYIF